MSRADEARQIADSMFNRDVAPNAWRAAEAGALKALSRWNNRQLIPVILLTHAFWVAALSMWGWPL